MSDSLQPHEPQHTRPPCPSPTPGTHPNPCPLNRWCHLTISFSVVPFSSCPQSFPASGSFPVTGLFASGFPCGSAGKESACHERDLGWSLGWEDSPGEGKGYPLQYSGLENSTDRGTWQTTVLGVSKSETQLSSFHFASGGQNIGASASASVLLMNIRY